MEGGRLEVRMVSPNSSELTKKEKPITIGIGSHTADDGEKHIPTPMPAKVNEELTLYTGT